MWGTNTNNSTVQYHRIPKVGYSNLADQPAFVLSPPFCLKVLLKMGDNQITNSSFVVRIEPQITAQRANEKIQ